jgi:hypothetical protein
VRLSHWLDGQYVTVTAIGREKLLVLGETAGEWSSALSYDWLKVPEPVVYPERWMNVYSNYLMNAGWWCRADADRGASAGRIAVIHLAADGTLTLHPVERES